MITGARAQENECSSSSLHHNQDAIVASVQPEFLARNLNLEARATNKIG